MFGSLARQFIPLLKPLVPAGGRHVLRTSKTFAKGLIDRKSVSEADTSGVNVLACVKKEKMW